MNLTNKNNNYFIETPAGIFTASGNWFFTDSSNIEKYVPDLLSIISLENLLKEAEEWIRSSDAFATLLFLLLIHFIPYYLALISVPITFFIWYHLRSTLVNPQLRYIVKFLFHDSVTFVLAIISISIFGIGGNTEHALISLIVFLVMRFGWFRKATDFLYNRKNSGLTGNDRILKMLIIRHAMKNKIHTNEVHTMEQEILEIMLNKKKPAKNV